MDSDSLFADATGLRAFHTEGEVLPHSNDASAGKCARTILAERFRQAHPSAGTTEEPQPMSVIGLKQ
jgi:hypothetical protein